MQTIAKEFLNSYFCFNRVASDSKNLQDIGVVIYNIPLCHFFDLRSDLCNNSDCVSLIDVIDSTVLVWISILSKNNERVIENHII